MIIGDAINPATPTDTEKVTIDTHENYSPGGSDYAVVTGCGASGNIKIGNSSQTSITATEGSTCTYTVGFGVAAGYTAYTGYVYASNGTTATHTVTAGGDTFTLNVWRVYYNEFTGSVGGVAGFSLTGMYLVFTVTFDAASGSCTGYTGYYPNRWCWSDYGQTAVLPAAWSNPPANSRVESSTGTTTTTAAITSGDNDYSQTYYPQLSEIPRVAVGNSAGQTTFVSGLGAVTVKGYYDTLEPPTDPDIEYWSLEDDPEPISTPWDNTFRPSAAGGETR